jgi:hypothetical protein
LEEFDGKDAAVEAEEAALVCDGGRPRRFNGETLFPDSSSSSSSVSSVFVLLDPNE